ncbi:MAG: pyridoxal phosphate-dependent aminotransferase [Moraxellaceae bacterium]|nr:pyridoxal phosphate-dependent aminotransferase [Moraxellaceae bacterium]MBP8851716.1 pyridoxal phosphate-dependent aminotransferase [Moraxellaceae bacterium]MBP9046211.1 pyridoxal phosphate-dependent aminotransferase [Moraxellaceae bacterium]MBP9731147.1 pyridoxal phosphate-dependent aminotransferase [Moraxellaceae bacterium]MCC6199902.1 pyridoxal phosphate-dependent aminotransferase [Moraxellaceae bacterium]
MDIRLSDRVLSIKPSPTLAVTNKAAELKAAGKDIIGLGAGEPDFDTPEHIKAAATEAIAKGFTKYTAVDGTPGLKKAIIAKFKRDQGLDYAPNQILVSCGGKQSFFNMSLALLNKGDEVIIPAPFWVSYPDMVIIADGTPVIVECPQSQGYKITAAQLEKAITPKTRLVVLNSPSNPTGMVYSKAELLALADVLRKNPHVLIATDDMYEHIIWTAEKFENIVTVAPDLYDRTIVLNGVSKAYAMTGWRIGYAAGPVKLINAMKNVQSQSTSNPTSISQVAAEAALNGPQEVLVPMVKAFKERHDYVVATLNTIPGVSCSPADGAFYAFCNVEGAIAKLGLKNDLEFSEHLLNTVGVAVVPGSAFGLDGHMRISYATSMKVLEDALGRIRKAIEG